MTAIETLRANIEARRGAAAISIRELERRADLGTGTIAKFLADPDRTLGLDVVEKIAAPLGCTVLELMGAGEAPSGVRNKDSSTLQQIHPDQLVASPLNPRKATALDKGAIADLARSIAEKGVLQNLIARPFAGIIPGGCAPVAPLFEIVAGERRWRAACHALAAGMVAPDFTLPVAVRELADEQLVELALVENIDRADMSPLEEADAIAFLHERAREAGTTRDFTRRLAEATGKTDRWVQQRVRLARDLSDTARAKLVDGTISLQMAKELSEVPRPAQEFALAKIEKKEWGWDKAETVQQKLAETLPPCDQALFKLDEYDGGFVERAASDGIRRKFFADAKQAERLQAAALKAKLAAFAETRAFVEKAPNAWGWDGAFPPAPKDLKAAKGEAKPWGVVWLREGFKVVFHDRRVKRAESGAAGGRTELSWQEEEKINAARVPHRAAFGRAVAAAFDAEPATALRVFLFASLVECADQFIRLSSDADDVKASMLEILGGAADPAIVAEVEAIDTAMEAIEETFPRPDDAEAQLDALEARRNRLAEQVAASTVAAVKTADTKALLKAFAVLTRPESQDEWRLKRSRARNADRFIADLAGVELPPALQHELTGGDIRDFAEVVKGDDTAGDGTDAVEARLLAESGDDDEGED